MSIRFRFFFLYLILSVAGVFSNPVVHSEEPLKAKKYTLSVAAIFKNEGPYLKEWIEYNRLLGVEHFYLYNNGSTDHFMEVLKPYIESEVVTLVEWPDIDREKWGTKPFAWVHYTQVPAYKHACEVLAAGESKWIALIDIDEFIVPVHENKITDLLEKYEDSPGITIHWRIYGTSGLKSLPENTLLIQALNYATPENYYLNKSHVKSIFKPELFDGFIHPPHRCKYKGGLTAAKIKPNEGRINHYMNRTEDVFYKKKIQQKADMDNAKYTSDLEWWVNVGNDLEDEELLIHRYVPELRKKMGYDSNSSTQKTVFLSIITRNNARLLPKFLKSIENIDYDKKLIVLYIRSQNNDDNTKTLLNEWVEKNMHLYRTVIFLRKDIPDAPLASEEDTANVFKYNGRLRNESMRTARHLPTEFYFSLDTDCLITPETLQYLISKDKQIIAPMLRSSPDATDLFSTYFCDVNENGYYKDHPDYMPILNRSLIGTFKVPLVYRTYLIKSKYLSKLNHLDDTDDYDFIVLARNAQDNGLNQFICNEKRFGVFSYFRKNVFADKNNLPAVGEEFWMDPIELLTADRFDVIAKYIYAKQYLNESKTDQHVSLYKSHIGKWNNFFERDPAKNGFEDFQNDFHQLIANIKLNGFDPNAEPIPVNSQGFIINGSHRVGACLALDTPVKVKVIHQNTRKGIIIDSNRMRTKHKLEEKFLDQMALEYAKIKSNARIVYLFPDASQHAKELENTLLQHGDIVYSKEISLNQDEAKEFIQLLSATRKKGRDMNGSKKKAKPFSSIEAFDTAPLKIYLYESSDPSPFKIVDSKIQTIGGTDNHSCNISDSHEQTVFIADMLFRIDD